MWADGAIVHVVAEGPFNLEGVELFSRRMQALYRELPEGRPFVNLTELRHTLLATPDAWAKLETHLRRISASGLPLIGTAWIVAPEIEGRSLLLPLVERLFGQAGRVFKVFETMDAAQAWGQELLRACNAAPGSTAGR